MSKTRTALISAIAIGLLAGSTVSVTAQDEPVEVTGQVTFSSPSSVEMRETNDPRLTGTGSWDPAEGYPRDQAPSFWLNGRFLTTDEGTWRQLPVPSAVIAGAETWQAVADLTGTGAYEGLSAWLFTSSGPAGPILGSVYPTDLASCGFSSGG